MGSLLGREVGGKQCLGIGTGWKGAKLFQAEGCSGADRAMPVPSGGVVRGSPSLHLFRVAPALLAPLILHCHFPLSLLHENVQRYLKLIPTSLG